MSLRRRLIRFGFRLLYNELAFTYDTVSYMVSLGAWRCWQRTALKHLDIQPGALILELAHGSGNLQLDLYTAGYSVIGYDLSPYMGRIAQSKLKRHQLAVRLARGRAQQLPFASQAFAAVVSTFPAEFILAPETLREAHRVLQPNGQFIIVPTAFLTGGGLAERGLEWLYHLTGQRNGPSMDIVAFFAEFGYEARVSHERCPHSVAQVIVAQKKV